MCHGKALLCRDLKEPRKGRAFDAWAADTESPNKTPGYMAFPLVVYRACSAMRQDWKMHWMSRFERGDDAVRSAAPRPVWIASMISVLSDRSASRSVASGPWGQHAWRNGVRNCTCRDLLFRGKLSPIIGCISMYRLRMSSWLALNLREIFFLQVLREFSAWCGHLTVMWNGY